MNWTGGLFTLVRERRTVRQSIREVAATGWDPEDERALVLDLLRGTMVEKAEIPIVNRRLSDDDCVRELEEAYGGREAELNEMYRGA